MAESTTASAMDMPTGAVVIVYGDGLSIDTAAMGGRWETEAAVHGRRGSR